MLKESTVENMQYMGYTRKERLKIETLMKHRCEISKNNRLVINSVLND
jgi:hypothetical protein